MRTLRSIFSINTVILVFAVFIMIFAVQRIIESYDGFEKLISHQGVVKKKFLSNEYFSRTERRSKKEEIDSTYIFNFKIAGDPKLYSASRLAKGINNLVEVGDSIIFYTKNISSSFGNTVSNGKGKTWNIDNSNEVFHIVSKKYDSPVLDFEDYRSDLKSAWILPLWSIILLGWYFYRRSGFKSPFIY